MSNTNQTIADKLRSVIGSFSGMVDFVTNYLPSILTRLTSVENALVTKENSTNKVTALSSSSTDVQYPSAKCVYDNLELKSNKINIINLLQ